MKSPAVDRSAAAATIEPQPDPLALEPKRSVLSRVTLSNSELYRRIKAGQFPAPVPLSPDGRRVAWVRAEVDRWLAERIAQRGAAK